MEPRNHWFRNKCHVGNQNNMRLDGKLCDVIIKVNHREFQAHKVILASNLKYFESMFVNSFQESNQSVVTMKDVRAADMEAFIMYAYTGKILFTEHNMLNIFELANYLTEEGIKDACVNFLKIHLKKEDACLAYKMANLTSCFELKNVAKRLILLNFRECTVTADYLSLDFKSLEDILAYNAAGFVHSQQVLFEGIVRWILYDTKRRRPYVHDVLNQIKITEVKADYLLQYFCECIENQCDTIKDIMIFYRAKSKAKKQSLMIVGNSNTKFLTHFQIYDFFEKKWGPMGVVTKLEKRIFHSGTVFENQFYYITSSAGTLLDLRLFNPASEKTSILTTDRRILLHATVCTNADLIYFCGGITHDIYGSNQLVTYKPETNFFEILPPMRDVRWGAASIFFQGCLYVIGGYEGGSPLTTVEKYDPDKRSWTVVAPTCVKRYHHAVAVLDDKIYTCGGVGDRSVEVYDPVLNSWRLVASMNRQRCDFLLVSYEDKLLSTGGGHRSIEMYDPVEDSWQILVEMSADIAVNSFWGGVIPTNWIDNPT